MAIHETTTPGYGFRMYQYSDNDPGVAAGLNNNEKILDGILQILAGKIIPAAYGAGTAYTAFTTACTYSGNIYLCIANSTGNSPSNATYWLFVGPVPASGTAQWRYGSGAPASGLGNVGDAYTDTSSGNLYYKTGTSTWTFIMNIKGPSGGNAWHSGSGAPSGSLGNVNDFYCDEDNGDVYTKTGATEWTLQFSIRGPQGDPGEDGTDGVDAAMTRTSTTELAIGTGSTEFTYTASLNLGWLVGARLRAAAASDATQYMEGIVTEVSSTAVTLDVDATAGAGTYAAWNIFIAGQPAESAGSQVLFGDEEPSSELGSVNDVYVRRTVCDVYKKTGASTWTLQGNIRGLPGTQIYILPGTPGAELGNLNDGFLSTTTGDLYKKTGVSTWTVQGNLVGPMGIGNVTQAENAAEAGRVIVSSGADKTQEASSVVLADLTDNTHTHHDGDGGQISYADLADKPTFGSAAAAATTDFDAAGAASTVASNLSTHAGTSLASGAHGGIPPGVKYCGTWSALSGSLPATPTTGNWYLVADNATVSGIYYRSDDWIIWNGLAWLHARNQATTAALVDTASPGFCPTAPNDTTKFLRGDAFWAVPTRTGVYREIFIPASAMIPNTTNGAAVVTAELSSNKQMVDGLDFDASTQQSAGFGVKMPDAWDRGPVKTKFFWTNGEASGSGNVIWGIKGVATSDDDAMDASWGTAQEVTDAFITDGDRHSSAATSAITIGGSPALGDWIDCQVYRKAADGSDTYTKKARLLGIAIQYAESSTEPSAW